MNSDPRFESLTKRIIHIHDSVVCNLCVAIHRQNEIEPCHTVADLGSLGVSLRANVRHAYTLYIQYSRIQLRLHKYVSTILHLTHNKRFKRVWVFFYSHGNTVEIVGSLRIITGIHSLVFHKKLYGIEEE